MTATTPRRVEVAFTTTSACLVEPPRAPTAGRPPLLVALHGQGESGERHRRWLADAIPDHFAAAFPDGFHKHEVRKPEQPIRLGYGWYVFTGDQEAFAKSLAEAEDALFRLIEVVQSALDTDPARVFLAGFSQGGYLAHCAAVRHPDRIAGWVGQSSRLKHEFLEAELPRVAGKPVLIQHGRADEAMAPEVAERSAAILREHGADVTLQLFDAGHRITPEMTAAVAAWLAARAGNNVPGHHS